MNDLNDLKTLPVGRSDKWDAEADFGNRDFNNVPVTFIDNTAEAVEMIHTLGPGVVAMDTETVYVENVIDPFTAELRVISIATELNGEDVSYVLDVKDMDNDAVGKAFQDRAAELGHKSLRVSGFNANFDDPVTTLNLGTWTTQSGHTYRSLFEWVDLTFGVTIRRLGASGNSWWGLARATQHYLGLELDGKGGVQLSYDADTPLTEEQIRYAANDAIATLWLGDALVEPLTEEGLLEPFSLECSARPFLLGMTVHGLPFNKDGWMQTIAESKQRMDSINGDLAAITGGQPTLFGPAVPNFNPSSHDDVRDVLNTHATDLVAAYLESTGSPYRELQPSNSTDKVALGLMKSFGVAHEFDTKLIDLLLEYSSLSKLGSTYGSKMMALLDDENRFHSKFTQCQIETGRTSSTSPNAQNFAPAMKPFFNPPNRVDSNGKAHERVIVHGDYSQAELRTSAQLTGEPVRREAFDAGVDQHEAVAGRMFNVDMAALKQGGPDQQKRYKRFRSQAKPINFGLAYGLKSGRLAQQLTLQGVQTTKEEAGKLISDFFDALPKEAAWLGKRDKYVENLADRIEWTLETGTPLDFDLTLRLRQVKATIAESARRMPKRKRKDPEAVLYETFSDSMIEARSRDGETFEDTKARFLRQVTWAMNYDAAVVLREDGAPWEFYSRTRSGRRRIFQVSTEAFIDEMTMLLARPANQESQIAVDNWAAEHGMQLARNPHVNGNVSPNRKQASFTEIKKAFEGKNKQKRFDFVVAMLATLEGRKVPLKDRQTVIPLAEFLYRKAMSRCVRRLANAYRNAPIQGTVADGALYAFWKLYGLLEEFPFAYPVTTVHDSIAIECDQEDAPRLKERMEQEMVSALERYVPDVTIVADVDILNSLDDSDIVEYAPTA